MQRWLDLRLPDGDALSLIANWRRAGIQTPVVIFTVRSNLDDRIAGLDCGTDDYLAKPFAVDERLARLRAVLRRPARASADSCLTSRPA